jgi:hypothetical protein
MKYLLLIQNGTAPTPGSDGWDQLSEGEQKAVYADYQALRETVGVTSGLPIAPPEAATTVRVQDGVTMTSDGPFAADGDALAGYLVFETDDPAAAVELAARIPQARMGGAVEVRPIVES